MSVGLYMLIDKFILKAKHPLRSGLLALPIFYGVTLFVNLFSIIHDGPKCKLTSICYNHHHHTNRTLSLLVLHMDNIPNWLVFTISSVTAIVVAILVQFYVVPWQRKKILGQQSSNKPVQFTFGDSDGEYARLDAMKALSTLPFI